jgi:hypothetical protein
MVVGKGTPLSVRGMIRRTLCAVVAASARTISKRRSALLAVSLLPVFVTVSLQSPSIFPRFNCSKDFMKLDIICFVNPFACVSMIPSNFFIRPNATALTLAADNWAKKAQGRRTTGTGRACTQPHIFVVVRCIFFALCTSV